MAEAQLNDDSGVPDTVLAQVAELTYARHLRQFATTLLDVPDVQYDNRAHDADNQAFPSNLSVSIIHSICTAIVMVLLWSIHTRFGSGLI